MRWPARGTLLLIALNVALTPAGCSFGPKALECSHGKYNEAVKRVGEEQMLLNIVRLRYNDNPLRLDVSSIAAQYELDGSLEARPFFSTEATGDMFREFSKILPFAGVTGTNRPTISLTPLDDPETLRGLFTPATADGIIFLAETSYPVSTVFRLWVEYLNRVPNAVAAGGPTREFVPGFRDFQRVARLLQTLQDRGDIRFIRQERVTKLGSPMPAGSVTPTHLIEAAQSGLEYVEEPDKTWALIRRDRRLDLKVNPLGVACPEVQELVALLGLKQGELSYEVTVGPLVQPFALPGPEPERTAINLFPRSVVQ